MRVFKRKIISIFEAKRKEIQIKAWKINNILIKNIQIRDFEKMYLYYFNKNLNLIIIPPEKIFTPG